MLQMPHGGASTFTQIPMVGPWGKYPTHGKRSQFYLMIEAKNIRIVFSGFSRGFKISNPHPLPFRDLKGLLILHEMGPKICLMSKTDLHFDFTLTLFLIVQ